MKSIKSIFKRLLLLYLLFYIKHKRKIRSFGEETKLIFALNKEDFLHTCLFHTNPVPFWVLNITQSSDPAAAAAAAAPSDAAADAAAPPAAAAAAALPLP
jgi:hypothetical protein